MKERPILFSGPMVRAILSGHKTQTRRPMKPQPQPNGMWSEHFGDFLCLIDEYPPSATIWNGAWLGADAGELHCCPYGVPGDRLWVRETWRLPHGAPDGWVDYRADDSRSGFRWRPSIHMPRWASRLLLEVKSIRVERINDISESHARAEGIIDGGCLSCGCSEPCGCSDPKPDARDAFAGLWEDLYSTRGLGWHVNPWVWAVEFERVVE